MESFRTRIEEAYTFQNKATTRAIPIATQKIYEEWWSGRVNVGNSIGLRETASDR